MNEYFAKKMAAIKQKQSVLHCTNGFSEKQVEKCSEEETSLRSPTLNSEEVEGDSTTVCKVKKKKKKKAENERNTEDEAPPAVVVAGEENNDIIIVKKKKKKKKSKEDAE